MKHLNRTINHLEKEVSNAGHIKEFHLLRTFEIVVKLTENLSWKSKVE